MNTKQTIIIISLIFLFGCQSIVKAAAHRDTRNENEKLTDLVNPLIGTDSEFNLSNGNTYPAIARP